MKQRANEDWKAQMECAFLPFPEPQIPPALARRMTKDQTAGRFQNRENQRKNLKTKENER